MLLKSGHLPAPVVGGVVLTIAKLVVVEACAIAWLQYLVGFADREFILYIKKLDAQSKKLDAQRIDIEYIYIVVYIYIYRKTKYGRNKITSIA